MFTSYLTTGSNWTGSTGILLRIAQHLGYTAVSVALAAVIAIPVGAALGHRHRGGAAVVGFANALRAVPTFAALVLLFVGLGDHRTGETVGALTAFALSPLVTNSYVGVRSVDPAVTDAARGMGMSGVQLLRQVELPLAAPLIMAGLRIAVVQVVATATVAAYIGGGGLGRLVLDGFSSLDYGEMLTGAALVAVLALVLDGLLGLAVLTLRRRGRPTDPLALTPRRG
jgi:osmoprotectant transport system permease protein